MNLKTDVVKLFTTAENENKGHVDGHVDKSTRNNGAESPLTSKSDKTSSRIKCSFIKQNTLAVPTSFNLKNRKFAKSAC